MSEYMKYWYLLHNTPPIEVGFTPLLLLISPIGDIKEINLADIAGFNAPLVTHSFPLLIDWFRRESIPLPTNVIEIELAKKLIIGRPKSDFKKGSWPWDMSEIMANYLPKEYNELKLRQALSTHLSRPSTESFSNRKWMEIAAGILPQIWEDLRRDLIKLGEAERFFSIEVPVYNLMLVSQLEGIRVAPDERDALLNRVENDYISAHHSLAITHRIDVLRALSDVEYLLEYLDLGIIDKSYYSSPEEIISDFKISNPICALLHSVLSAKRHKGILLKTFSLDSEFCYPIFDTMGTVTGRILAIDPQLQYLKKEYRSLLIPRDSNSHLYIDYSQFEPNIMGSLSCDPTLLGFCSNGDLYSELAHQIFGEISARDEAKIIFLAYSYGMGKKGLEKLASRIKGNVHELSQIIENNIFKAFNEIESWKKQLYKILLNNGRIGTVLGNYRYRPNEGPLDSKENRWAVSQVVQGTGALILKKVIQKLSQLIPAANILLPMHDALLIEVPSGDKAEISKEIETVFLDTFIETCPGTNPRVSIEPFANTKN